MTENLLLPSPNTIHQIYYGLKERVMIIGDVHGCFVELQEMLQNDYRRHSDTLIFVGDLVNKGPMSVEVVQFVRNEVEHHGALCVRGNHEDSALFRAFKIKPNLNGKYDYLEQFSR